MGRFYIDCEFDGHNGPLLSLAIVPENDKGIHIMVHAEAHDPWVIENVVPLMPYHHGLHVGCDIERVGYWIRQTIGNDPQPVIIADSPVDIGRFCCALSTGDAGGWASADYERMTFLVENVDCYPTELPEARQHNAWWDAMALRHKLTGAA